MSTERPLLVSSALIGPTLRGEKRVTRRLIRAMGNRRHIDRLLGDWSLSGEPEPYIGAERPWRPTREPRAGDWLWTVQSDVDDTVCEVIRPPCAVGDVLWVRETWAHTTLYGNPITVYNAEDNRTDYGGPWKPSIHMKRADARIFLRVENVRVERVQEITEEDARAEGVIEAYDGVFDDVDYCARAKAMGAVIGDARPTFALVWDSLAPAGSKWADNPWVWVIRFKLEAPNVR